MRVPKPPTLLALGIASLVVAYWWFGIVVPGRTPDIRSVDLRFFFYPTYHALFARVADGELPLWNPYQLCGVPWLGSPQGGLFYPPHLLFLVLRHDLALAALGLLHLLLIALSTALFARRVGLTAAAAFLAALLFSLRGVVRSWYLAPPLLEAGSWLPLGCVAVVALARRPSARAIAALAGVSAASWLAGGPQATVYLLYAWTALLPAMLAAAGASASRWLAGAASFVLAIGAGTLIAGIQLAPSMEMAAQGTRAMARLQPDAMFVLGGEPGVFSAFLSEQVVGKGTWFSLLAVSLLAAMPFARGHRALACWCAIVGGIALVFSQGRSTGLFGAYSLLPALGWFRNPLQLRFLVEFCLAIAAAIGLHATSAGPSNGRTGSRLRTIACGAAVVVAVAICIGRARSPAPEAAIATAGLVVLLAGAWRAPRAVAIGLGALAVVEIVSARTRTEMLPYGRAASAQYDAAAGVYEQLRALLGPDRVWIAQGSMIATDLTPKLASYRRVRSVDDYESITLRRQSEYFTYLLEGRITPANRRVIFAGMLTTNLATSRPGRLARQRRLLDLAAVRLVLMPSWLPGRPAMRPLDARDDLRALPSPRPDLLLFENPRALPRAYVAHRIEPAPEPTALLTRLADPSFDPLATSYVEGSPSRPSESDAPRGHAAAIVRDDPELVEVEATLDAPGLLVLADSYYPGWRATVDGEPATILPTNHLFRGVEVAAGTHRVRFEYRPASVAIGAAASALGLVLVAGLAFAGRRDRDVDAA